MAPARTSSAQTRRRFQDARGNPVSLLDPYLLRKLHMYSVIPADPLRSIARNIGSGWAKAGRVIFSIIWPVVILCVLIAHVGKWGGGWAVHPREMRLWIVLMACLAVNIILVWSLARSGRRAKVCRIMLEHLRCPQCGYDIRGLPTDPVDGATVCPECGSAWKLDGCERSNGAGRN